MAEGQDCEFAKLSSLAFADITTTTKTANVEKMVLAEVTPGPVDPVSTLSTTVISAATESTPVSMKSALSQHFPLLQSFVDDTDKENHTMATKEHAAILGLLTDLATEVGPANTTAATTKAQTNRTTGSMTTPPNNEQKSVSSSTRVVNCFESPGSNEPLPLLLSSPSGLTSPVDLSTSTEEVKRMHIDNRASTMMSSDSPSPSTAPFVVNPYDLEHNFPSSTIQDNNINDTSGIVAEKEQHRRRVKLTMQEKEKAIQLHLNNLKGANGRNRTSIPTVPTTGLGSDDRSPTVATTTASACRTELSLFKEKMRVEAEKLTEKHNQEKQVLERTNMQLEGHVTSLRAAIESLHEEKADFERRLKSTEAKLKNLSTGRAPAEAPAANDTSRSQLLRETVRQPEVRETEDGGARSEPSRWGQVLQRSASSRESSSSFPDDISDELSVVSIQQDHRQLSTASRKREFQSSRVCSIQSARKKTKSKSSSKKDVNPPSLEKKPAAMSSRKLNQTNTSRCKEAIPTTLKTVEPPTKLCPKLETITFRKKWMKVGDPVFAEYTDGGKGSYYFGLISEIKKKGTCPYTVTFDDGDVQKNLQARNMQRLEEFDFLRRMTWIEDDLPPPDAYLKLLDKPCRLVHMKEKACGRCHFCKLPPCTKCYSCRSRRIHKDGCLQTVCLKFSVKARMQNMPCIPAQFKYYFDMKWDGTEMQTFPVLVDDQNAEAIGLTAIMNKLADTSSTTEQREVCDYLGLCAG